jgi:tripartite-type tricarboxylate transporter receptor subunit TctC
MRLPASAAMLSLLLGFGAAGAQTYPAKPVRVITQFGPGTPGEIAARLVITQMSAAMGQPLVLESRAGGGGALAAASVARAEPDGYTIGVLNLAIPVTAPGLGLTKDLSFDPVKDLAPITTLVHIPAVMAAHPSFPPNSVKELVEYAKANPGKVMYGTTGVGSSFHLTIEQVSALTGAKLQHIPYKTSPVLDAASGAIHFAFVVAPQAIPLIKAGKVKAIGVVSHQRSRLLPDVATVLETVPGYESVPEGTAIFAPGATPLPILRRLHAEAVAAVNRPEARDKLVASGSDIVTTASQEEMAALVKRQIALVARIVRDTGLKLDAESR